MELSFISKLKIIDLSTVLAGPSVGTFFAELGAQVLKIENAAIPDVTRSWKLPSEDQNSNVSAYFSSVNYRKEFLQLNLKSEVDYLQFIDLVKDADILISNFKFGDEAKLKLTDEDLRSVNKNLIIGKINGFGAESDRVAYDLILQAESGFMSMNGTPESGPVKMPVAFIDVLAAHQLKEGLLLALLERQINCKAKTIEVSLYDAAICSLVNQASNYLMAKKIPQRIGSLHPNIAPYGEIFETKDQQLITFAIGSAIHFEKLCTFLELENLVSDERFSTNQNRVINRQVLFELLQARIVEFNADEILNNMLQQHVPAGKIKNLEAVFSENTALDLVRSELIEGTATQRLTSIAFKWK
ncbi:MAG: CoA transferase [Flavobacteriales bacterium]|nr:CoA transferase [Flavobacteriales bacterium]